MDGNGPSTSLDIRNLPADSVLPVGLLPDYSPGAILTMDYEKNYEILKQQNIRDVAATLNEIQFVAVVRPVNSNHDQVPPVFVATEALVFCAWQTPFY